jgi:hypothetical protein
MNETKLNTVLLPLITIGSDPATDSNLEPRTIAAKVLCPKRVLIRNLGFGGIAIFAFDEATLLSAPSIANTFQIPAGASEVIPMAPGQTLYGSSPAAGTMISIAVSDALPIT